MQITINIPENIANQLQQNWQNLPQKILESIAIEAYKNKVMDIHQVQEMLQFPSLLQTEKFLQNTHIYVNDKPENTDTKTLAAAFQELQQICQEEDYYLEIPSRQDRPNPFDE